MEKYIGKDFIHYGCGMELNPAIIMKKISHTARKNLKKASKANIKVKRVKGSDRELQHLREIWYYYDDPNFPLTYDANRIVYMAFIEETLVGGVILLPVGKHLFLNNLMANDLGKKYQLQGYLLWCVANDLQDSEYDYIDIGVSYRWNLYRFFKKWSTFNYPVIFNVPEMKPHIDLRPFKNMENLSKEKLDEEKVSAFFKGRPFTIVPDVNYANNIYIKESNARKRTIAEFSSDVVFDEKPVSIIDLTKVIPVPFGAAIMGVLVPTKILWDTYGCYDHYKVEYIKKYITKYDLTFDKVNEERLNVYRCYEEKFLMEDVTIKSPDSLIEYFTFTSDGSKALSRKYSSFGVPHTWEDEYINLPCHQNISEADIEYIYAIYRGHLNLCSEWVPTNVKGEFKK